MKRIDGNLIHMAELWESPISKIDEREYNTVLGELKELMEERGVSLTIEEPEMFTKLSSYDTMSYNIRYRAVTATPLLEETRNKVHGIVFLAHELGHDIDLQENYGGDINKFKGAKSYETEVDAWKEALKLLQETSFTNWYGFEYAAFSALTTYIENSFWPVETAYPLVEEIMAVAKTNKHLVK
jgi:hypothetical protein